MKKTITGMLGLFALTILFSAVSYGQNNRRPQGINARQQNQRERIFNGVRFGELTVRETRQLVNAERRINRQEARFRESGDGLNWRERAILQAELQRTSHQIYRQKHDKQDYPRP